MLDKLGALKKSQDASRVSLTGLNKSEVRGLRDLSEQPTASRQTESLTGATTPVQNGVKVPLSLMQPVNKAMPDDKEK